MLTLAGFRFLWAENMAIPASLGLPAINGYFYAVSLTKKAALLVLRTLHAAKAAIVLWPT